MIPPQWTPPCNSQCTHKYAALTQIPWRVFCKKGCDADGETWDECLGECDEICYKDPVLKDQQWSAYIDRSPGSASYSEECFRACVSGCGYKNKDCCYCLSSFCKCSSFFGPLFSLTEDGDIMPLFEVPSEKVSQVHSRPPKPPIEEKPADDSPAVESRPANVARRDPNEVPNTCA